MTERGMIDLTRKYTLADVRRWGPCYTPEKMIELQKSLDKIEATLPEILDLPIPPEDRLWLVLQDDVLPEPALHELACWFAKAVLPIYESRYPDTRPRDAIAAKRAWLQGEISNAALAAARAAAWAAAGEAAGEAALAAALAAARAAAWAAAGEAALAAARAAAGAAAWAAAGEAAGEAALAAARAAQLCVVRTLIAEHTT